MTVSRKVGWISLYFVGLFLASPSLAHAHTAAGDMAGVWSGLAHPLGGLDHLCAMIGVGLWASQRGGRALWLLPLVFLAVMAVGGILGMLAISIPFVEQGIVSSVLILGILISAAARFPLVLSALVVGTFAFFHGHAHGAELPSATSPVSYATGFIAATALLHLGGIAAGLLAARANSSWLVRSAGAAVALCGAIMFLPF